MSTVHVVPLGDLVEHDVPGGLGSYQTSTKRWLVIQAGDWSDESCACSPRTEHVPSENGPDGWVVVHHSLDGREHQERAQSGAA